MTIERLEELVRPNIRVLAPYSTARDEYAGQPGIFLDANESPYPEGWNRYPDPHQKALKAEVSRIKGLPAENIFLGNGSDEAIDLVFRIFCTPERDNAVIISPSYGMYGICAAINGVEVRPVPLGKGYSLPVEGIRAACDPSTKVVFLCSPNNPSGNAFSRSSLLELVRSTDAIVVVDEAYADFSSEGSLRSEVLSEPNLIVLQTFSKAWGMAALRLGMAFACKRIAALMANVKYPYNISEAVQRQAIECLRKSKVESHIREIISERGRLAGELPRFSFIREVFRSDANFILVRVDDADSLYDKLLADGIIVRNRNRVEGCRGCLRITVGLPEENGRLLKSLSEYEKGTLHRP